MQLSKAAFWDVNLDDLDNHKNASFIITRVFQYGSLNDIRQVIKYYTAGEISTAFTTTRSVDQKAISLAHVLGYI